MLLLLIFLRCRWYYLVVLVEFVGRSPCLAAAVSRGLPGIPAKRIGKRTMEKRRKRGGIREEGATGEGRKTKRRERGRRGTTGEGRRTKRRERGRRGTTG